MRKSVAKYVVAGLGLLAGFALLLVLRDGSLYFFHAPAVPEGKIEQSGPTGPKTMVFEEYEPVVRNNAFGMPDEGLTLLEGAGPSAPSAGASDIRLVGTVAGQNGFGYAFIEESGGKQDVFRTGDKLRGGSVLRAVYKDSVKLGGRSGETIVKLVDPSSAAPSAQGIKSSGFGRGGDEGGGASGIPADNGFVRKTDESTWQVEKDALENALENPKAIMTDARLVPHFNEGKQDGFLIKDLKPGGIYTELGIEKGDVLLRVNEYNISSMEEALQAFTVLKGMDSIQLDILREGERMTLTYKVR